FSSAIDSEPVPVVRLYIVGIGAARRRALPQVPIKLRWNGRFFAGSNRLPHIAVPGLGKVRPANNPLVNLVDDLYSVRRRALLRAHLYELSIFLLRLHQHLSLGRIVAAWFFHIDMLTGLQPGNGHR